MISRPVGSRYAGMNSTPICHNSAAEASDTPQRLASRLAATTVPPHSTCARRQSLRLRSALILAACCVAATTVDGQASAVEGQAREWRTPGCLS
jgi:hypothetical protein